MNIENAGKRIATLRQKAGISQAELADRIGVSPQAVSKWENGHNLPDIENLMLIAECLNVSYELILSNSSLDDNATPEFQIRGRYFHEDNMFTRVRAFAAAENLDETYKALAFMRERHAGQFRRQGKFTRERIQYINHPLVMACQAHAYGIRDDEMLAAILLHDTVEDTGITLEQLPFSDSVKNLVGLLTFSIRDGMSKEESKEDYYRQIAGDARACIIKLLDRCNNVSTMAGSFTRTKITEYVEETEKYVLPLADILKNSSSLYSDIAFLVKYHIISVIETVKCLCMSNPATSC